jgi:hypothetical protein
MPNAHLANDDLLRIWDSDSGGVPVFALEDDDGSPLDTSTCAFELELRDESNNHIATLPGIPQYPRSSGIVHVYWKGGEFDFGGLGGVLYAHPKIYTTETPNILLTPSLDVDTDADGIPDDWHMGGAETNAVHSVSNDHPSPSVIFGKATSVYHPVSGTDSDYLAQSASRAVSLAAGDWISGGVWVRVRKDAGATVLGGGGYYAEIPSLGGIGDTRVALPTVDSDWTFVRLTAQVLSSATAANLNLVNFDARGYQVVYNDAFLFKGQWGVSSPTRYRIPVRRRQLTPAIGVTDFSRGVGSFDADSNGDGFPDGWHKNAAGIVFSQDPTLVTSGTPSFNSLKCVLPGATGKYMRAIAKGRKYTAGQTWKFRVFYQTSGTLTGSPAADTFGLRLSTEPFDGPVEEAYSANFAMTQVGSWATVTATLVLASDHNALVMEINLNGATGTMWLDDAQLFGV